MKEILRVSESSFGFIICTAIRVFCHQDHGNNVKFSLEPLFSQEFCTFASIRTLFLRLPIIYRYELLNHLYMLQLKTSVQHISERKQIR